MTDAYLVVLSKEGVEKISLETEHARRFLRRRCYEVNAGCESCYWTLLPTEKAKAIRWLILQGVTGDPPPETPLKARFLTNNNPPSVN